MKKFNYRAMVSFLVAISFVILTVTGIVLYIVPPGRVAYWTRWQLFGLEKEEWAALHTIFGYFFVLVAAIHLYFNWKIFVNYLKTRVSRYFKLKRELIWAIGISVVIYIGTLWNLPPFSSIMQLGENIKGSWEEETISVPIPHAERMSIKELAEKVGFDYMQAIETLKEKGYDVDGESVIINIAKKYNVTPAEIYKIISARSNKGAGKATSGLGRFTLKALAQKANVSIEDAIEILKMNGIDAKEDDKIKDIAQSNGLLPVDIYNMLKEK